MIKDGSMAIDIHEDGLTGVQMCAGETILYCMLTLDETIMLRDHINTAIERHRVLLQHRRYVVLPWENGGDA